MDDLNAELGQASTRDFEKVASADTSRQATRNFDDTREQAAIVAAAKACRAKK